MSLLHIGFIAHEYPNANEPGRGLARYVQRVSHLLVERGHRATVFVLSKRDRIWNDEGITVYEFAGAEIVLGRFPGGLSAGNIARRSLLRGSYPALMWLWTAKRVERLVWEVHRQTPFDLLQSTNCFALGFTLRKNGQIPLVTRVSNYQPLWRSADDRQRSLASAICDWLEVKQVADSDASFAPSSLLAKSYARLEAHHLDVIQSPIDPPDLTFDDSFYREKLEGKEYLLFFGGVSRLKGADLIIDLLPALLPSHPDLSVVFVGEEAMISGRKAFEVAREKSKGFEDRVMCFPPISKKLLFPVIQHALAVLLPSRADNLPNACLEAQSLGKVVIGTRDSSLDEMVSDGITGFLAENGSVESLQATIERFLALRDEQRLEMEAAVRDEVERINQEDRIGMLERFYWTIINGDDSRNLNS